ncbi:HEAT repeat domain-containing protein [Schumannella sp. 10F1B-5-1]|nr:HEAT repeat domain-containing protein [Schumannella sp. 10F1B-5-1]
MSESTADEPTPDARRDPTPASTPAERLAAALARGDASTRLQSAMTAGSRPDASYVDALVEHCAVEPDFFVRDMLTWALTRHDPDLTVERVVHELSSPVAQARSQALHTLSKIGDARAWPAITPALLHDADDEVARAAWRTAAGLVPPDEHERAALAEELATELGRGERSRRRSLSRALAMLDEAAEPVLARVAATSGLDARTHALATTHLIAHPDADFDDALAEARRLVALGAAPAAPDAPDAPDGQASTDPD